MVLVDASSFVFRAYFQSIRQDARYNYRSDRLPTGAVRIFATKVLQFIREGVCGTRATHIAFVFDKSEDSFRKALYPAYKANRSAPPEDLVPQFPLMRAAVRAFGYTPIEMAKYEADDLIATYARQGEALGARVTIVSADKDLMQVISPAIALYDPASGEREERLVGEAEVVDYFGVPPAGVIDVQALAGDSSDNVPGAPGIGVKTAAQLINEYGDLETLLARAGEIKQPKRRETLQDPEIIAKIKISKQLVTLVCDVPVETPLGDLIAHSVNAQALAAFLKAMEFTTLTRRIAELYGVDLESIAPDPAYALASAQTGQALAAPTLGMAGEGQGAAPPPNQPATPNLPVNPEASANLPPVAMAAPAGALTPQAHAQAQLAAMRALPVRYEDYKALGTAHALAQWLAALEPGAPLAVDTETTALDAMQAELVGVSLACAPGQAVYIPLQHRTGDGLFDAGLAPGQIPLQEALALLKPVLEDPARLKIGQNIKYDFTVLSRHGITLAPYDDTMLLSYVLDAGRGSHGMDALSTLHLGHAPIPFTEVAGKGKNARSFDHVALAEATRYAAEDADITLRLWHVLKPRLCAEGLSHVYEWLERAMPTCLSRMEQRGIFIDRQMLAHLSGAFAQAMAGMESEIHALAGETFNLASPKQLGDILFDKMGLPGGKRTPTGAWATGASALEDLAAEGHALPGKILEWRQLQKLKSTYTDALPAFIHPQTGRVHTSFALASTTTGRLSSSDPNLQNIPVRNELGRKIRKAFVAAPGYQLVSADYSQIELRLLAHIADIPQLKKAFAEGIDIHALTASEMFAVPLGEMTSDIRRRAKAINFGIIYGISAFGLANQLSIPREEAGAYIKRYFERFPGIRDYMEAMKAQVRAQGYVETLFGRRAHFPGSTSKNPAERAFVERAAINAPIQGSAADLIRRAMLRMEDALAQAGVAADMLLQVHDELIFEIEAGQIARALPVIKQVMAGAAEPYLKLSVPLVVEAKAALNWDEAH